MNPLTARSWSPYAVGAAIGVLSWFAFATANHPLSITTAFVVAGIATVFAMYGEEGRRHGMDQCRMPAGG